MDNLNGILIYLTFHMNGSSFFKWNEEKVY